MWHIIFWKRETLNYLNKEPRMLKPANSLIETLICSVYFFEKLKIA
ncbi:uncharacterized protein METZ01_LOCUS207061 [marine metagenome]|uniref:Uncharacterized protein n=1 Tax=marine metagenome TaxID=408172 RepID=A0A382EWH8_9ZZZZ